MGRRNEALIDSEWAVHTGTRTQVADTASQARPGHGLVGGHHHGLEPGGFVEGFHHRHDRARLWAFRAKLALSDPPARG